MTKVWVGKKRLDVNIREELEPYFTGQYVRWTEEKLSAPSPFREDRHPSFFVNLCDLQGKEIAGTWLDSGTGESGNFAQLLARLRDDSEEDTIQYLYDMYDVKLGDKLTLDLDLKMKVPFESLEVPNWELNCEYLVNRGISEETIIQFGIRNDSDWILIPWCNAMGQTIAIKYRHIHTKQFKYQKGGQPLNKHLFGIDQVYLHRPRTVFLCEAEIDAMSCWTFGRAGVAAGGSSISDKQIDLLLRSGVEFVVLAGDNDEAGRKFNAQARKHLEGKVKLFEIEYSGCNDVNEYIQKHGCPSVRPLNTPLVCL